MSHSPRSVSFQLPSSSTSPRNTRVLTPTIQQPFHYNNLLPIIYVPVGTKTPKPKADKTKKTPKTRSPPKYVIPSEPKYMPVGLKLVEIINKNAYMDVTNVNTTGVGAVKKDVLPSTAVKLGETLPLSRAYYSNRSPHGSQGALNFLVAYFYGDTAKAQDYLQQIL
jgi:hypothetical protein